MTPEMTSPAEEQPKGMGEVSRFAGVFFEPGKTFQDIAARPTFLFPLILVLGVSMVYMTLFAQHVGWERFFRHQTEISTNSRITQLSPEQKENAIQMQVKFAGIIGYVGILLGLPCANLIWAAVLFGIVKGIMSVPIRYKQVFAAVCWASLPGVILAVLAMVVMFMKSPDDFNLANPLVFNPAAFMDQTTASKFVYSLAASLDLFALWTLVLVAFGLKGAGGKKLSMGGAMLAVFLPWAVWTLGKASLAGVFA